MVSPSPATWAKAERSAQATEISKRGKQEQWSQPASCSKWKQDMNGSTRGPMFLGTCCLTHSSWWHLEAE